jgi:hypothetical protein
VVDSALLLASGGTYWKNAPFALDRLTTFVPTGGTVNFIMPSVSAAHTGHVIVDALVTAAVTA